MLMLGMPNYTAIVAVFYSAHAKGKRFQINYDELTFRAYTGASIPDGTLRASAHYSCACALSSRSSLVGVRHGAVSSSSRLEVSSMKKRQLVFLSLATVSFGSTSTFATYNANMSGVVTDVLTYTDADYVFFRLDNQPASHPACNPNFFVLSASLPAERRKQILVRLLVAKTSGESINVGYDNTGDCTDGYIHVHRVG
jgi:hypothetical protein